MALFSTPFTSVHRVAVMVTNEDSMSDAQVPFYPDSSVQVQLDSSAAGEWQGDLLAIGLYEEELNGEGKSCACHATQSTLAFLQLRDDSVTHAMFFSCRQFTVPLTRQGSRSTCSAAASLHFVSCSMCCLQGRAQCCSSWTSSCRRSSRT